MNYLRTLILMSIFYAQLINAQQASHIRLSNKEICKSTKNIQIQNLINSVNADSIFATVQHLQNYGTRECTHPKAFEAQDWLVDKFDSYGYDTYTQDFYFSEGNSSENVIALKEGVLFPDQIIIMGAHYDSRNANSSLPAPGADDNASGVAGILETARVLKDTDFAYSIMFIGFSAEEYGAVGSKAFVDSILQNNTNIKYYLNLDMIGYVEPGEEMISNFSYNNQAIPYGGLFEFIAAEYVEDLTVVSQVGTVTSDAIAFHNEDIASLYPFENADFFNQYIHSTEDTIGLSFNNLEFAEKITQSCVGTLTASAIIDGLYPPQNLQATQFEDHITLLWEKPYSFEDFIQYKIYKNNALYDSLQSINDTIFNDYDLEFTSEYEYCVTAEYSGEEPIESLTLDTATIIFGQKSYYLSDFEDSQQNWTILDTEEGWQWAEDVSGGNGTNYLSINSFEAGFGVAVEDYAISPLVDLSNKFGLDICMDVLFAERFDTDFKILIKPAPQLPWITLYDIEPTDGFKSKIFNLPISMQTENCQVAFYYNDKGQFCYYAAIDNIDFKGFDNDENYEAPTNLNLSENNGNIDLSWDVPTANGVEKYYIYRNSVLHDSVENPSANSYTDTDINPDNYYYYFVTAQYELRQSGPSNFATYGEPEEIIETKVASNKLEIFPNPAQQFINIKSEVAIDGVVSIYDLTGRKVKSGKANDFEIQIHTGNLEQGTYFVVIEGKSKQISQKITIMK